MRPRRAVLATAVVGVLVAAAAAVVVEQRATSDLDTPRAGVEVSIAAEVGPLGLPLIPWEGGADYWRQFPQADRAGWSDPSFFPVVAWYDGISSNDEVAFDKSLGINTYIGMSAETPFSLFVDNDVFWIGGRLNDSFDPADPHWVGDFLDDEVDGRFTPPEGRAHLEGLSRQSQGSGRFRFANFTQMVIGDLDDEDANAYVNDYTDAVSIDMYWYTIPFCDLEPYRGGVYLSPVAQSTCRTSSSYGATMRSLRTRDAADGRRQALWQFVENVNGGPAEGPFVHMVSPDEVSGAVMSSLINEARGIVYFNQSFSGDCQGGNMFRLAQVQPGYCAAPQIDAVGRINNRIHELASVLNTQTSQWTFGPGLDTMLKIVDGDAYVFAMVDGSGPPGRRTFVLPEQFAGWQGAVEVVDENRSIPAVAGAFTDDFAAEYSWHIYRIPLPVR